EIGKIYKKNKEKYQETYRLALLVSGNTNKENWTNSYHKTNFYYLKGIAEQLLKRLNLNEIKQNPISLSNFSDAISLKLNGKELGIMGIVDKNILKKADVSQEVFYAEFDWELITEIASK